MQAFCFPVSAANNLMCSARRCRWKCRGQLKCDGTRAKNRFRLSAKRRVHLNRRGRQFSRLLAAEVCTSAVVMLDTPCSEVVWRVLATHSIRQFPLHFLSHASPRAITFQLESMYRNCYETRPRVSSGKFVTLVPHYPLTAGIVLAVNAHACIWAG